MSNPAQSYTPEEQAAAWAAYYAQQGYTPEQIAAALGTAASSAGAGGSSSSYEYGYGYGYDTSGGGGGGSGSGSIGAYPAAPEYIQKQMAETEMQAYQGLQLQDQGFVTAGTGTGVPGADGGSGKNKRVQNLNSQGKRETVIRKGSGRTWEDPSLLEWDPKWYRLFVGDVSNDVNERTLDEAFGKYPSYCKSKVVRDRLSEKAKYGFIAFKDPEDFLKAWKEMDGKYVGNRPIKLTKIKDDKYGGIATVAVSGRKARELDKIRKNRGKPVDGRPTPW